MREWLRSIVLGAATALCACGGSGSTGLISPESFVLEAVRRDGTCIESAGISYCATDSDRAVAPDGQSALAPAEMGMPGPCSPGDESCPGQDQLGFTVRGFGPGAACATAVRPGGDAEWSIGSLVPVGADATQVPLPEPALSDGDALPEIALLCFETAPTALPPRVATLGEANPDVVFVPRTT
jgi:hypothetical protein